MKSANQLQSGVLSGSNPLSSFDDSSTEVATFLVPFIPRNPIESNLNCTLYSFIGSECSLREIIESISNCTLSSVSLPSCTNTNDACSDASNDDCDCTDDDTNDDVDDASDDTSSSACTDTDGSDTYTATASNCNEQTTNQRNQMTTLDTSGTVSSRRMV